MKSKSILFGLAAFGTVGSVLLGASAPAEALSLGSSYTISGQGFFTDNSINFIQSNGLDPADGTATALVTNASGDFSGIAPFPSLPTAPVFTSFAADVIDVSDLSASPFKLIDFDGSFSILGISDDFDFTATSASFNSVTRRYQFRGFFGDSTPGKGEIAQLETVPGTGGAFGFSGTFTAVPTPALLPGLVGMGVAALRKRRSEEQNT